MENIGLVVTLTLGTLITGLGFLTILLQVAEYKTPAVIALIVSVAVLAGTWFLFTAGNPIDWVIFVAWPWMTGIVLGKLVVIFGDDDEEEASQADEPTTG